MSIFNIMPYVLIIFSFLSISCKQTSNRNTAIPIQWEYASSEQFEPFSFTTDKVFAPLEAKRNNGIFGICTDIILFQKIPLLKGKMKLPSRFTLTQKDQFQIQSKSEIERKLRVKFSRKCFMRVT